MSRAPTISYAELLKVATSCGDVVKKNNELTDAEKVFKQNLASIKIVIASVNTGMKNIKTQLVADKRKLEKDREKQQTAALVEEKKKLAAAKAEADKKKAALAKARSCLLYTSPSPRDRG